MAIERRKLEELNLLDNFLFGKMMMHPDYGDEFSRQLLRLVLNRKIGKLLVIPQKVMFGSEPDQHGAVLDVYLEEEDGEGETTLYDVEAEKDEHAMAVESIPKRMRFYRAKIDGFGLKTGENYGRLKKLIMIMITPFDPFGLDRMRYTVKNMCAEAPEMPYDDGTIMIFLNTKGKPDNESNELRQFLKYLECSTPENAVTEELQRLHGMVERVKHDEEVSVEFMRLWEDEERIRAQERENTERERVRADAAEAMAKEANARAEEANARAEAERARAEEIERKYAALRAGIDATKSNADT